MAIVRSLTAEKIYAIEAETVVDAHLRGDNLILVKHDGTEIDVGSVKGPVGASGDHNTLLNLDMDNHAQYLNRSGVRPMTGPLLLAGDPSAPLAATPKQYVDSAGGIMNVDSSLLATAPEVYLRSLGKGPTATWGGVVKSTNFLVLPVAGWYRMGFHAFFSTTNVSGTYRTLTIGTDTLPAPNGDTSPIGYTTIGATITQSLLVSSFSSPIMSLSASGINYVSAPNTKVGVWLRNDASGSPNIAVYATFSVELIKAAG